MRLKTKIEIRSSKIGPTWINARSALTQMTVNSVFVEITKYFFCVLIPVLKIARLKSISIFKILEERISESNSARLLPMGRSIGFGTRCK